MELNRHDCTVFGIGAAVGGLLAWAGSYIFFSKKEHQLLQWNEKCRNKIDELQEEKEDLVKYNDALKWQCNRLTDILNETDPDNIPTQASDTGRDKGVLSRQQRDDIRRKLEKNYEGTTNYATQYGKIEQYIGKMEAGEVHAQIDDIEGELAEKEHPEDDEAEIDESYVDPREQEHEGDIGTTLPESSSGADVDEFFKEHQKKKGRKPRIISVEEAANLPEYIDAMTWFYYATNDVMVDEDEEIIEDPERYIGDALTKYDFANNDEKRIFVMNYELDTCFEIMKILGSYEVD